MTILEEPRYAMLVEFETVAKKKPAPAPVPDPVAKTLFSVKGDPAWYDWLKRYADSIGISATTAIDVSLREQAKRDGFLEPMPKRFGR